MATAFEKESKVERIELRVTPNAKALLTAAAEARHTTVSEFLLRNGIQAAEEALTSPRIFFASEEGWQQIHDMLAEEPTQPAAEILKWLRKAPRIR